MPGLGIEREITIEAPADVVWRTITEPDQLSRWFLAVTGDRPFRFSSRWNHPRDTDPVAGNSRLVTVATRP